MEDRLMALSSQVAELLQELRDLRRENADLRRQLAVASGVTQHQPYALPTPVVPTLPPRTLSPDRSAPPGKARTVHDLSPGVTVDKDGEAVMPSPPLDANSKRARRSLASDLDDAAPEASPSGAPTGP